MKCIQYTIIQLVLEKVMKPGESVHFKSEISFYSSRNI